MRKKIALVIAGFAAVAGVAGSAAPASADGKPVEVRRECGSYNVYVNGSPLITNVWCPDHSTS